MIAAGFQTISRVLDNDTLTRTRKELDRYQGFRRTGSNRGVRVLQTSLQKSDEAPHG